MRNTQGAKELYEWLRSRRRSSSLMALMAHQTSLILLFLLPQTLDLFDSSGSFGRYSVSPLSDQFSNESLHWKGRNYINC